MSGCYFYARCIIILSEQRNVDKKQVSGGDMNYTYIAECRDGSLYTGWTTDLEKRISAHNAGKGAKYTKNRRPVRLVYFEEFETKEEAMKREYAIKHMSRSKKIMLIGQKFKEQIHTSQ
jgi:putative endonuclease